VLAAGLLAGGALIADTADPPAVGLRPSPERIAAIELAKRIRDDRPGPRVIDVRSPSEFDDHHLATAANVPLDHIAPRVVPAAEAANAKEPRAGAGAAGDSHRIGGRVAERRPAGLALRVLAQPIRHGRSRGSRTRVVRAGAAIRVHPGRSRS